MPPSPYAPHEAADIIRDEVAWLQGAFISSLLCGVQITLSTMSFFAVLKQRIRRRLRIVLLLYIFLLCVIMTAGQQTYLLFIQMGFIEYRNYPGGPNHFLSSRYSTPVCLASTSLFLFANWMMEALLVWRCKVVCTTEERPMWLGVIVPSVLLVSEYATGALLIHDILRRQDAIAYAIAYTSVSLMLNITVTAIIVGRLLAHRRRMVRLFGSRHGSHYVSAATILIESASLYTGFLILVIIFFTVGTAASNILQQAVAQVEAITSLLIIYRIAQGKGWKYDAGVSTGDWRGDTEVQVEQVELPVANLERVADTQATQTANVMHALSIPSKEDEPQTPVNVGSVPAILSQDEAV
ncbi:hypothetical protein L210DRAFT_3383927 [Boletus edulis BED1]|uniref:Uncharacterized protein n=1 Tax=Boletus edulis BED1 TaxID=1328754 RepID=A0AAD4C9U3_BOLED|nr:hypothetical protein L210DRAFT_3383927 [Boletus edulis BED1]